MHLHLHHVRCCVKGVEIRRAEAQGHGERDPAASLWRAVGGVGVVVLPVKVGAGDREHATAVGRIYVVATLLEVALGTGLQWVPRFCSLLS